MGAEWREGEEYERYRMELKGITTSAEWMEERKRRVDTRDQMERNANMLRVIKNWNRRAKEEEDEKSASYKNKNPKR